MPPIRAVNSSYHLRKGVKLDSVTVKANEHKSDSLSRRLPARGSEPDKVAKRCYHGSGIPKEIRMDNKYGQVSKFPIPTHRISGASVGHFPQFSVTPEKEDTFPEGRLKKNHIQSEVELAIRKESPRQAKFCCIRNTSRKASLQRYTKSSQHLTGRVTQAKISYSPKSSPTMHLVDSTPRRRSPSPQSSGNRFYHFGRFRHGLGRSDKWESYQRSMEPSAGKMAHKYERTVRSYPGLPAQENVSKKQKSDCSIRQSYGYSLHKKSGWDKILTTDNVGLRITDSGRRPESRDLSSVYPGDIQRCGGQPISSEKSSRLAAVIDNLQPDLSKMGHPRSGSIRFKHVQGCPSLCLPRCEGSQSPVYRRFQQDMGVQVSMGLPTTVIDPTSASPPKSSEGCIHFDRPAMGESILEVGPSVTSNRPPISNSKCSPPSARLDNPNKANESRSLFGGLEGTGWSIVTKNWSKDDCNLLQRAWRNSSLKTYSAPWKLWLTRCQLLGLDPNEPDAASVAQHLSFLFREKKLSPNTIKLHKSVIATFASPFNQGAISNNLLVKNIIKAIELSKPTPVKKQIWDVKQLLTWLENFPIQIDNIFQVSRHLALLLLLASGRRIHDLTLLRTDKSSMLIEKDSITFWPDFGSKTDSRTHRQSAWKLSRVPNEKLDPVRWTNLYLEVSEARRSAGGSRVLPLFITSRGKVSPASKAIIAGWVKTAFSDLNIDFSPGSIRSAVASSRKDNNVPLDTILRNGNWKSDRNVIRHYFKEIIDSSSKDNTDVLSLVNTSFSTL